MGPGACTFSAGDLQPAQKHRETPPVTLQVSGEITFAAGGSVGNRKCHEESGDHVVGGHRRDQLHDFLRIESRVHTRHQ